MRRARRHASFLPCDANCKFARSDLAGPAFVPQTVAAGLPLVIGVEFARPVKAERLSGSPWGKKGGQPHETTGDDRPRVRTWHQHRRVLRLCTAGRIDAQRRTTGRNTSRWRRRIVRPNSVSCRDRRATVPVVDANARREPCRPLRPAQPTQLEVPISARDDACPDLRPSSRCHPRRFEPDFFLTLGPFRSSRRILLPAGNRPVCRETPKVGGAGLEPATSCL
jgi:hypothetical protein